MILPMFFFLDYYKIKLESRPGAILPPVYNKVFELEMTLPILLLDLLPDMVG